MALTKIDDRGLKTPIDLLDNEKIRFGTGNDLDIFHDSGSTKSMINNQNGELRIVCDNAIRIGKRHDATIAYADNMIVANPDGAVELYWDNSKKFETTTHGINIGGDSNVTGSWSQTDWNLEVYDSTADCYILFAGAAGAAIELKDTVTNEAFVISANGDCNLYSYKAGDNIRFHNTPTGGSITERMRIDSSGRVGIGTTSPLKKLHISDAGDVGIALQTTNANTNKEIWEITCGSNASSEADLIFQSRTDAGSGGSEGIRLVNGGAVQLYYDNSKKFETTSSGIDVTGQVKGSTANFYQATGQASVIIGSGNGARAVLTLDGASNGDSSGGDFAYISHETNGDLNLVAANPSSNGSVVIKSKSGSYQAITAYASGAVELRYQNTKKFETTSDGATVTGELGVNTTSPTSPLDVRKDNPASGRLAVFGTAGTPYTSHCAGVTNALSLARARISVPANTWTNLVAGYGGSMVLVTLVPDSGVADVQMTFMVSHAWSVSTQLFYNTYGANQPTISWSAASGYLRMNHNHSGTILVNVATLVATQPTAG